MNEEYLIQKRNYLKGLVYVLDGLEPEQRIIEMDNFIKQIILDQIANNCISQTLVNKKLEFKSVVDKS